VGRGSELVCMVLAYDSCRMMVALVGQFQMGGMSGGDLGGRACGPIGVMTCHQARNKEVLLQETSAAFASSRMLLVSVEWLSPWPIH